MTMYEQSQQSDWLQTELESMSLQAASPAKTSQSQEIRQEYKTELEAGYGQSAPVWLGKFDPDTPSLKTSQTCLMENGELGLKRVLWDISQIGYDAEWHCIPASELGAHHHRDRILDYCLPQRRVRVGQRATGNRFRPSGHKAQLSLQLYVRMFPTPTASDSGSASRKRIEEPGHPKAALREAVFWPTPNASDNRDRGCMEDDSVKRRLRIGKQVGLSTVVKETRQSGTLNPAWVEWLMGFPIGHTDLNA